MKGDDWSVDFNCCLLYLAKILFPVDEVFFMVLLESKIKLKKGDSAPNFELLGIDDKKYS